MGAPLCHQREKEKPDVRASRSENAACGYEGCSENPQEYLQTATRLLLSESGRGQ